jgi:hypothetical protein
MEQTLSSNLKGCKARAIDKILLMLWVFSYATILQVFRALRKLERRK